MRQILKLRYIYIILKATRLTLKMSMTLRSSVSVEFKVIKFSSFSAFCHDHVILTTKAVQRDDNSFVNHIVITNLQIAEC